MYRNTLEVVANPKGLCAYMKRREHRFPDCSHLGEATLMSLPSGWAPRDRRPRLEICARFVFARLNHYGRPIQCGKKDYRMFRPKNVHMSMCFRLKNVQEICYNPRPEASHGKKSPTSRLLPLDPCWDSAFAESGDRKSELPEVRSRLARLTFSTSGP